MNNISTKISIYDFSTYTLELKAIMNTVKMLPKEEIEKFKDDYDSLFGNLKRNYYKSSLMTQIIQDINDVLLKCDIVCFHNTRVTELSNIINNGLNYPSDHYCERVKKDMINASIPVEIVNKLISEICKLINVWESDFIQKDRQVCFYLSEQFEDDFSEFYKCFGGEVMRQVIKYMDLNSDIEEKITSIGHPVIVKFFYSFSKFEEYKREDIIIGMLAYWIESDFYSNYSKPFCTDGRLLYEIPSQNILYVKEVRNS